MYDTSTRTDHRSAFSDGDIDTASPARVLVKCFDRLDADLERALASIERHDHETTNRELGHAQDLLGEMAGMLDTTAWEHSGALLAVYDYVLRLLAVASMRKLAGPAAEAQRLLREIGDGFRVAAANAEQPAARDRPTADPAPGNRAPATGTFAGASDGPTSISVLA